MKKPPFKIKVNVLTLIRWVRKYLKWRRKNILNRPNDVL